MKNKTKGVIAGVAGLALLTGGATFARWTAEGTVAGGSITNGSLAVAAGDMEWQDVSEDRDDSPHDIDSDWLMVPGDTARGVQELTVELEGDNLVANLSVERGDDESLPDGVTVTYRLLDGDGEEIGDGDLDDDVSIRFAANATSGDDDTVVVGADGTTTLVVEVTVHFDLDDATNASVGGATVLDAFVVTLTQDRAGAGFGG